MASKVNTIQNHMKIIENVLRNHFIPAIISESSISEPLQQFIAFSIQLGGMVVTISYLNTEAEYNASRLLIVDQIINQNRT